MSWAESISYVFIPFAHLSDGVLDEQRKRFTEICCTLKIQLQQHEIEACNALIHNMAAAMCAMCIAASTVCSHEEDDRLSNAGVS